MHLLAFLYGLAYYALLPLSLAGPAFRASSAQAIQDVLRSLGASRKPMQLQSAFAAVGNVATAAVDGLGKCAWWHQPLIGAVRCNLYHATESWRPHLLQAVWPRSSCHLQRAGARPEVRLTAALHGTVSTDSCTAQGDTLLAWQPAAYAKPQRSKRQQRHLCMHVCRALRSALQGRGCSSSATGSWRSSAAARRLRSLPPRRRTAAGAGTSLMRSSTKYHAG